MRGGCDKRNGGTAQNCWEKHWPEGEPFSVHDRKQVKAPYVPEIGAPNDTRHFDRYPDSEPGIEEPLDGKGQEKFHQFDTF